MAAKDAGWLEDLFEGFAISTRKMFGGTGLYHQGVIFGMLIEDAVYLKVDGTNAPAFDAEGCPRFAYPHKDGRMVTMSYARIPDRLLDDPAQLANWARDAHAASLRAKK